jgi:DNA-binding transcriptional LysR family regulator
MEQAKRLNLNHMLTFYWIARSNSFTGAAAALRMPKSTVSQQLRALETRLGARLIQRTTRNLALTEVGRIFLAHCERMVAESEEAECAATSYAAEPRGLLRVGVPATFSRVFLAPLLPAFCRKYPQVRFEFVIPGGRMDPLANLLDVVLRIGKVEDSSYIVRQLGSLRRGLFAAKEYLLAKGTPSRPQDLPAHALISTSRTPAGGRWRLRHAENGVEEVRFEPQISVPDPVLAHDLTRAGLGIGILPSFVTRQPPGLVRVLQEWDPDPVEIVALYPARQLAPLKLKVFLHEVQENLRF